MDQKRWQEIENIFYTALEMETDKRAEFLKEICPGDESLRTEVESLLMHDEQDGSLLEVPAMVLIARRLSLDAAISEKFNPALSLVGKTLSHYQIIGKLGRGGMGEVYLAHDSRLGRNVALKTLTPGFVLDPERLARFRREAHTLASLNHPNIGAIYGLEEYEGSDYLVLELVEGDTLNGPLPLALTLDYAFQVAEALEAAHMNGIIHRDLKPANVKVTPQGRVKVLDFGLAKAILGTEDKPDQQQSAKVSDSVHWHIIGTPAYMSPEQARGIDVDQRTDIWAFGCLLYELLTGKRAFKGETISETIKAVMEYEPDWQALPAGTPAKLIKLINHCLCKDINQRLNSITDARLILEHVKKKLYKKRLTKVIKKPIFAIPAAALILILIYSGIKLYQHNSQVRWVREQAIPEISRQLDKFQYHKAYPLMRRAEAILPNDPTLKKMHHDRSFPTEFNTTPAGAEVWATGYDPEDNDWIYLGTTPFTSRELLMGIYRLRITKTGYRTILGTCEVMGGGTVPNYNLDKEADIPTGMVRIPGGYVSITGLVAIELNTFLIDRYEVTNRQFKEFINKGGYQKQEYWKQEFLHDGRRLSWEEAMYLFHDITGQPGPSTWKHGDYPQGYDDCPVNGVSWYEAAAYAEYAGKQLPTIYHWQMAASPGWFDAILTLSNFKGDGPARVGSYHGIGPFGTLDMAGNVKEWCWNEIGANRSIRGGAWDEPVYVYDDLDSRLSWDRSPQNGIRCALYDKKEETLLKTPIVQNRHDFQEDKPVSDEVFHDYQRFYEYDSTDLDARVEYIVEENFYWICEKVSFVSVYGNERIFGYLYLPKNVSPPYQVIIYAHPGMALRLPEPQPGEERIFDYIVKRGRAFLLPVLKGQYERQYAAPLAGGNEQRDRLILESKEFRRSIDYLANRADMDSERIGIYGLSRGAALLPILAVGEKRLKASVLVSVGLAHGFDFSPEVDPKNFLPRFKVPTLMINGKSMFGIPVETSQRPMLRLLGAPDKDKHLDLSEGGHVPPNYAITIEKALDWFDRYLGPVQKTK
ncbi:MAG: protein kinase [Deltaproteobacteria bacterium]|nr:protein kinase [Deltaproteobacteria bacterium]